jgi:hypothetical protein
VRDSSDPVSSVSGIEIALDLDRHSVSEGLGVVFGGLGDPRVSLIQCFAVTRHLQSIIGAVQRAISHRRPITLRIAPNTYPAGQARVVGADRIAVQPAVELVRLQASLLRAIAPGIASPELLSSLRESATVELDELSTTAVLDFLSSGVLPSFAPPLSVDPFSPVELVVRSLSMYELGLGGAPRSILWRWTIR